MVKLPAGLDAKTAWLTACRRAAERMAFRQSNRDADAEAEAKYMRDCEKSFALDNHAANEYN